MKLHEITKEILINSGVNIELDENGEIHVTQKLQSSNDNGVFICGNNKRWSESRKIFETTAKHKYGDDITYYRVILKLNGAYSYPYPLHAIMYIWFKGPIKKGYDVDHIDGDHKNNNPENLQLLSRKDNLAKRKGFKNQYDVLNYREFGETYIELAPRWRSYRKEHDTDITFRNWYKKIYLKHGNY